MSSKNFELKAYCMSFFNLDHPLVDGIILLQLSTPTCPSLLAMTSGIQNFSDDIKSFEFCTPTSGSKYEQPCTFLYNNGDIFYYTLFFRPSPESSDSYELVIKSYQRCVHFFFDFFKKLLAAFDDDKSTYDPDKIFTLAKSLVAGWPTTLSNKVDIVYPDMIKTVEFTIFDFTYHFYKPSFFFKPKMYGQIFDHLLSQRPILLHVPDAVYGCKACFSAFSLLHPLRYMEKMIFWLRSDDPRYKEISETDGKSPYLIVSTDSPNGIKNKFDLVIKCFDSSKKMNEKADFDFEENVKNVLLMIQGVFKDTLNKNPYGDILNLPWVGRTMEEITQNKKYDFMPSFDTLKVFESSETCRFWRQRRCKLENIREPLLQCENVDVQSLNKKQLETITEFFNSIKGLYEHDVHLKFVIKKHMNLVNSQLAKIKATE